MGCGEATGVAPSSRHGNSAGRASVAPEVRGGPCAARHGIEGRTGAADPISLKPGPPATGFAEDRGTRARRPTEPAFRALPARRAPDRGSGTEPNSRKLAMKLA